MLSARRAALDPETEVRRLLPNVGRRLVGAWCFVDQYGPDDIADRPGMRVAPHPHIGLQTVSWLLEGEVLHRDSLGNEARLSPGELGLMTAGAGIAHAERSPLDHSSGLHGVQLWVALPDHDRFTPPDFDLHPDLPVVEDGSLRVRVILGELLGARSPGRTFTPIVGADVAVGRGRAVIPLDPSFEHALLPTAGSVSVDGVHVGPDSLLYQAPGRTGLPIEAAEPARLLLLGGELFEESIVMWWNFVARSGDEMTEARRAWMDSDRFGAVHGYDGEPSPAPPLPPVRLKPRGRV